MNRRVSLYIVATVVALAGFAVGLRGAPGTQMRPVAGVPLAEAINCQSANASCGGDTTKTSVLRVGHRGASHGVIPNTGETWDVTGLWVQAPTCSSGDFAETTATVTVNWNGSGWSLSNVYLPAGFSDIIVCDISYSCATADPEKKYKLLVDLDDTVGGVPYNLQSVTYQTTSVDNGLEYTDSFCTSTTAVSPTSQSWNDIDSPGNWASRCNFSCSQNSTGAAITIVYH